MWYRFTEDAKITEWLQHASPDLDVYQLIGQKFSRSLVLKGTMPRDLAPYIAVTAIVESIQASATENGKAIPASDHEMYREYLNIVFAGDAILARAACTLFERYLNGDDTVLKIGQDPKDYNAIYIEQTINPAPVPVLQLSTRPHREPDKLDLPAIK